MWSIGCIIYELYFIHKNNEEEQIINRYPFKGTSCYPLSPESSQQDDKIVISGTDQLLKILQVLGIQSEENLCFYEEQKSKYVQYLQQKLKKGENKIDSMLSEADEDLVSIIKKLFHFNPLERISAEECLLSNYFDTVRYD